jgi:hypothetical protein
MLSSSALIEASAASAAGMWKKGVVDIANVNGGGHRDEIVRLEAQIDELADRIESCRKFILVGKIAVIGGSVGLIATLIGAIEFDPSVLAVAGAAVLGGVVAAGSNRSTAREATHELTAAEAKRTALIGQINLRVVSDRDG